MIVVMSIHVWVFNFVQSSHMFSCWSILVIIIIYRHGNPSSIALFCCLESLSHLTFLFFFNGNSLVQTQFFMPVKQAR